MSGPTLFLLGASHQTAPLELREKLALAGGKLDALHGELQSLAGLDEFAVLNTCNRVEIYGVAAQAEAVARLQAALCALNQMDARVFEQIRLELHDRPAIQHLLEVAAGIDSQMVGETEILGQVKDAYAAAQTRGTTGPVLNRVFQKTFQAAKHVRTHTAIGEGQISVASVAVDLALKIFGDLRRCRVLVLGAGDIGEKTARAFKSRAAGVLLDSRMAVVSRHLQHAEELAGAFAARAIPFDQMAGALPDYDIVVCSLAAPGAVVTRAMAALAMRRRATRSLFFIDLAMPRNIDPDVAALPNVFLYNLDDLAKIAEENLALRQAEMERVRALLAEKAEALWRQIEPRMGGNHAAG
jgi:glutamyl-tRNA reductase